jgi:hypothetical protein
MAADDKKLSVRNSCGEWDDSSKGFIFKGGKKLKEHFKERKAPDNAVTRLLGIDWELRFFQKGPCCYYAILRYKPYQKSLERMGPTFSPLERATKFEHAVRIDGRFVIDRCTWKYAFSGQLSTEGKVIISLSELLKDKNAQEELKAPRELREKLLNFLTKVADVNIAGRYVLGSEIVPLQGVENYIRLEFFLTIGIDATVQAGPWSIQCRFAH